MKRKKRVIWPYLILIAAAVLLVFYPRDTADNVTIEISNSQVRIENMVPGIQFELVNERSVAAECFITITTVHESYEKDVGLVAPNSRKIVSDTWSPDAILNVSCNYRNFNITGCENTTFELCEIIRNKPRLGQCLHNDIPYQHFCAAYISNNSSICSGIRDMTRQVHCFAYVDDDPHLCGNLTIGSDWCYGDIAMNKGRADLCEKISDQLQKRVCLAVVNQDIEECKAFEDNTRCIIQLAHATHDTSICNFADDKDRCYEETLQI